jgi:hypothetical protein
MGAILTQVMGDNTERPIAYASRSGQKLKNIILR